MWIIMLTVRGQEVDRVMGFETGADDYVTKPFSLRELVARIKVGLRRQADRAQRHYAGLVISKSICRRIESPGTEPSYL